MEVLESALEQGLAPAIVVGIYLVVIKFIDARKENTQAKLSAELVKSISIISNYIDSISKNIVNKDKDKCKISIENSFHAFAYNLVGFVVDTLTTNHIDINRASIEMNIKSVVNAGYYNIFNALSMYTIDNTKVSEYLKSEWIGEIEKGLIDCMFNQELDKEDKILAFSNKIDIKFKSYVSYINNHIN